MSDERWGDPERISAETVPGRRGLLATLLAVGTAVLAGSSIPVAVAKKKRKRCKKKKACPPVDPPQPCVGLCDPNCGYCYRRNAASNLCADTLNIPATCMPCTSDKDCLGTNFPYCISSQTPLATGEADELACPDNPPGICGRPNPC